MKNYFRRMRRAYGENLIAQLALQVFMGSVLMAPLVYSQGPSRDSEAPKWAEAAIHESLLETVDSLCGQFPQHRICGEIGLVPGMVPGLGRSPAGGRLRSPDLKTTETMMLGDARVETAFRGKEK